MKVRIVVFPGSNCDTDCLHVFKNVLGVDAKLLWHKNHDLEDADLIVLPGGFSYGDYLRCGAIAKFSPIMEEVVAFAKNGGHVLGICNGFQILIESGLLPGALMRNRDLKFLCKNTPLKLLNEQTPFTQKGTKGDVYNVPIAHMDGNYFIDEDGLKKLKDQNQIVFQYADIKGEVSQNTNPNGSVLNIAGIVNEKGNVLGMMPHPERVSEDVLGHSQGKFIFESILEAL